jgi:hypothetical protein
MMSLQLGGSVGLIRKLMYVAAGCAAVCGVAANVIEQRLQRHRRAGLPDRFFRWSSSRWMFAERYDQSGQRSRRMVIALVGALVCLFLCVVVLALIAGLPA